ncbi:hypothetical protein GQ54DRAFT_309824, partial [Martensiomyces pterosporus]
MYKKQTTSHDGPRAEELGFGEGEFRLNDATFSRGVGFEGSQSDTSTPNQNNRRTTFFGGIRQSLAGASDHKEAKMDTYEMHENPRREKGGTGGEGNVEKGSHEHVEDVEITRTRRFWVFITWMLTFWIPSPLLNWCGRMKRSDVRMAWREKVAICILIIAMWFILLFIIIGLGLILCPKEYVWTMDDVSSHNTPKSAYVALRGSVYDVTDFMKQQHGDTAFSSSQDQILQFYAGNDINGSFPIPARVACPQFVTAQSDPNYQYYYPVQGASDIDQNQAFMFQHMMNKDPTSKQLQDPNFYTKYALPVMKKFKKGGIVWKFDWINSMYKDQGKYWRVINKEVFNMQPYFDAAKNGRININKKYNILDSKLEGIMDQGGYGSADITKDWDNIKWDAATRQANYNCMKNLFYVGNVDDRQSVRCLFTNYMLLAFACLLMFVVLVKFLAALQFGNKKRPIPPQKFVICQVPCYTEDDDSLSKTINSLAGLEYQDNHKLMFIICDGNIVGSGNDRSTPRIVLDILGVDP